MPKVGLINGSHQKRNYTGFTLAIIRDELKKNNFDITDIKLKDFNLPFPGDNIDNDNSQDLRDLLNSVDAYIVGCPEYNGSFTAKLKLMVENAGFPSVLKGKPLGLVGIASGVLGATKSLEQQRIMFSHVGSFVLPRVVSIPQVEQKFDENGNCIDEKTELDIRMSANNLIEFVTQIYSHKSA